MGPRQLQRFMCPLTQEEDAASRRRRAGEPAEGAERRPSGRGGHVSRSHVTAALPPVKAQPLLSYYIVQNGLMSPVNPHQTEISCDAIAVFSITIIEITILDHDSRSRYGWRLFQVALPADESRTFDMEADSQHTVLSGTTILQTKASSGGVLAVVVRTGQSQAHTQRRAGITRLLLVVLYIQHAWSQVGGCNFKLVKVFSDTQILADNLNAGIMLHVK